MACTIFKLIFLASLCSVTVYGQNSAAQDAPTEGLPDQVVPVQDAGALDIETQDIPPMEGVIGEDPVHQELQVLKDAMKEAFNKRDIELLTTHLDPNVVITWANGKVSRGSEGLKSYFKEMMENPERVVKEIKINPDISELSIIHGGDTGIAWGTSEDQYKLATGLELSVTGFWSMTVVKSADGWKIAAFQSSMNAFDNAIIDNIRKTYVWVAVGMLIAGLAFGAFFMRLFTRH